VRFKEGPRPWPIWLFAGAFLTAAAIRLLAGLAALDSAKLRLFGGSDITVYSDDAAIVALASEFTIALIPIVWIFGIGSWFARWFVLAFGLIRLFGFRDLPVDLLAGRPLAPHQLIEPPLIVVALACLLLPAAAPWFRRQPEIDPETFA
jgi:hypothetical protein